MRLIVKVVATVLLMLGLAAGSASAAPVSASASGRAAILPDCKEAPKPNSPWGNPLTVKPATTSTADPFAPDSKVSIASVYGTGYGVFNYDNGCGPGSGIMPSLGAGIVNVGGMEWPATLSSMGSYVQSLLVEPEKWISVLDAPVQEATAAVTEGFWRPWLVIAMLLVAALVLSRSVSGRLAGGLTATVWAVLVLTISAWLVNYPTEATELVDDGVKTAAVEISNGFSGSEGSESAAAAMSRQWDEIDRATVYRTWLDATFGSSTSKTAQTYGPDIFKSTHFTWAEWDAYQADPEGKGKEIIEAKAENFTEAADKVKEADPIAYDHLTGNRWMDRIGLAPLAWITYICSALFLVVSSIGLLLAYVVIRVLVPFGPAAGIIFLLEPMREAAMNKLQKVAPIIVMGPAYLLAALLVLRFNSAILGAEGIARVLQILLVAAVSYLAWRIIRPAAVGGLGSKLGRMLRQAAAVRLGTRGLRGRGKDKDSEAAEPDEAEDNGEGIWGRRTRAPRTYRKSWPVAEPEPLPIGAGVAPVNDAGVVQGGEYHVVASSRGTFTDRPATEQEPMSPRRARDLSVAVPVSADGRESDPSESIGENSSRSSSTSSTFVPATVFEREPSPELPSALDDSSAQDTATNPAALPAARQATVEPDSHQNGQSSAAVDGLVLGSDERLPDRVHEANLTFTEQGEQVFEVYRPAPVVDEYAPVESEDISPRNEISRSANVVTE